jgi:hypothetical protein
VSLHCEATGQFVREGGARRSSHREPGDLPFQEKRLPGGVLRSAGLIEWRIARLCVAFFDIRTPKICRRGKRTLGYYSDIVWHQ